MINLILIRVVIAVSNYIETNALASKCNAIYWRKPRAAFLQNEQALLKVLTGDLMTWLWW